MKLQRYWVGNEEGDGWPEAGDDIKLVRSDDAEALENRVAELECIRCAHEKALTSVAAWSGESYYTKCNADQRCQCAGCVAKKALEAKDET
jgi:hypothetical protein